MADNPNSLFTDPADLDSYLWRYMDFTKFVSLLDSQKLFFCKSNCFDDQFEGTYPKPYVSAHLREFDCDVDSITPSAGQYLQYLSSFRQIVAISSWHMSHHESAAMWKLYLKSGEGIAVRTTYRRLKKSLSNAQYPIHLGLVKYIDFEKYELEHNEVDGNSRRGNFLEPFMLKRQSFEHEKEVRAILVKKPSSVDGSQKSGTLSANDHSDNPIKGGGVSVPVNLNLLIESITLAPRTPDWLQALVSSVAKKYGIQAKIFPSELDADPLV